MIKQLANNEIDLEVALSRLMIIASDINNEELYKWAESELNGYSSNDALPNYRKLNIGYITYSGINGRMQVTNQPIPLTSFTPDERKLITGAFVFESIRSLQQYAHQDKSLIKDLTFLAESFFNRQGIRCTSINMHYDSTKFIDILSNIRTKLLSMFIKLDKEFGCLDELDIDIKGIDTDRLKDINDDLYSIIYTDDKAEVL